MDYIDYTQEETADDPRYWTHKGFKKYFTDTYLKIHRVGGAIPWSMKEQVQLATMLMEYTKEDLADMILYWHINARKSSVACQFTNFYSNRVNIYHTMKEAHSDYKWD